MNFNDEDVVWWDAPPGFGDSGVYKVICTPWNYWDLVIIESKIGVYTVANISELEKLNLPWE